MATDPVVREQARTLRQEGLSVAQIAEQLGIHAHSVVQRWVAGIQPPEWTRRPNAKDDLRARARELRLAGATYREIRAELGVSSSSVSLWVRDLPVPAELLLRVRHARRMNLHRWRQANDHFEAERRRVKAEAASWVGGIDQRDLMLLGAALYWAEGAKDKPYARREFVALINSDPDVIRLFLRWLDLMAAPEENRRYRLSIHESADLGEAHHYWSGVVGVPVERFDRPTLKRHKPQTVRRNTGGDYHGCLVVSVTKSRVLYQQIDGLWRGIVHAGHPVRADLPDA